MEAESVIHYNDYITANPDGSAYYYTFTAESRDGSVILAVVKYIRDRIECEKDCKENMKTVHKQRCVGDVDNIMSSHHVALLITAPTLGTWYVSSI